MKRKIIYIVSLLMVFVIASCDNYLDQIPPHSLVENNAITDQATAEAALIGAFYPLKYMNPSVFGAYYTKYGSHMIGFTTGRFTGFDDQLSLNNYSMGDGWDECSEMINTSNMVIEKTAEVEDSKFAGSRKNEIIAEARFLRFFAQYYLLRYYSQFWDISSSYGALMRREPAKVSNNSFARSTVAETYTLLLEDLDFVIQNGPEFTTVYRPSKLLGKAYKAELLLMRGNSDDLQNAITIANEVLGDSKRQKETTYADIFGNGYNSSELLFTRYMDEKMLSNVFGNVGSIVRMFGGIYEPTPVLDSILDDDLRTPFYKRVDIETDGEYMRVPKLYKEDGNCLPYYMRTSEMELLKAEAYARLSNKKEAIKAVNNLRRRAGEIALIAEDIPDNELTTTVYNEIVKEMALENGAEWFAAIRMNGKDDKKLVFKLQPNIISVNQFIWPIPQAEMEYNELIIQNPGYENLY